MSGTLTGETAFVVRKANRSGLSAASKASIRLRARDLCAHDLCGKRADAQPSAGHHSVSHLDTSDLVGTDAAEPRSKDVSTLARLKASATALPHTRTRKAAKQNGRRVDRDGVNASRTTARKSPLQSVAVTTDVTDGASSLDQQGVDHQGVDHADQSALPVAQVQVDDAQTSQAPANTFQLSDEAQKIADELEAILARAPLPATAPAEDASANCEFLSEPEADTPHDLPAWQEGADTFTATGEIAADAPEDAAFAGLTPSENDEPSAGHGALAVIGTESQQTLSKKEWIRAARRRRWTSPIGIAAAWLVTLAVGGFVVAIAAMVIVGPDRMIQAFNDLRQPTSAGASTAGRERASTRPNATASAVGHTGRAMTFGSSMQMSRAQPQKTGPLDGGLFVRRVETIQHPIQNP